jgi:hypothetical protein
MIILKSHFERKGIGVRAYIVSYPWFDCGNISAIIYYFSVV